MGDLLLGRPLEGSVGITSAYNKWRDVKKNGRVIGRRQHKGIDYDARLGMSVKASESGQVLRASWHPPKNKGERSYGNLIIIYHNPGKPDPGKTKDRYIYTLYAHLKDMSAKYCDYVEKGEEIGFSGDTGEVGPHLHFEVIDAGGELGWEKTGNTGVPSGGDIRKNPDNYYNQSTKAEGTLPDMVERAIMDRIEFVSDIDLERRDSFRLQAWLDGRNLGYVNKYKDNLKTNFKYDLKEELRKLQTWRKPLRVPKNESIRLEYKIRLQ